MGGPNHLRGAVNRRSVGVEDFADREEAIKAIRLFPGSASRRRDCQFAGALPPPLLCIETPAKGTRGVQQNNRSLAALARRHAFVRRLGARRDGR